MLLCPHCYSKTRVISTLQSIRVRLCPSCKFSAPTREEWLDQPTKNHQPRSQPKPQPAVTINPTSHPLWDQLTDYERGAVILYLDPTTDQYPHGTVNLARATLAKLDLPDPDPPR